jgi:type II secretory pathway pseudopilin PulG
MSLRSPRGILLIDVLVGIAIVGIVFTGLFGAFELAVVAVSRAKVEAEANALLNSEMEYVRSLPYGDVGTPGGAPGGTIPAMSVQSVNGTAYTVQAAVEYIDDPADGTGASDEDSNPHDYKSVLITVSWQAGNATRSVSVESYVAPPH